MLTSIVNSLVKPWTLLLAALLVMINCGMAQPSWADAGKYQKTTAYQDVTQTLDRLIQTPEDAGLDPAQLQQQIADLRWQKYILETAENRAQCRNQTGHVLGIYAKFKKDPANAPSTLYYLADGQAIDDDWECTGIVLPANTPVAIAPTAVQTLAEPTLLTVVPGAQVSVTSNPTTGAIEVNVPPLQVVSASAATEPLPTLTQAEIDAQLPNAPID